MDNLKRVFKSMFKRGKKNNKQDYGTTNQSISATPPQSQPPQSQLPQSSTGSAARPPQLPPIQNNSPLSATDTSKPLPPTHPLSTGQHSKPQEAVPQNHDARPGPPAPITKAPAASGGTSTVQEQGTGAAGAIAPPERESTIDGTKSADVAAVSNAEEDNSLQSPPKTDSGIEAPKPEEHNVTDSQPTTATKDIQPNGTTTEDSPTTDDTPVIDQRPPVNQIDTNAIPEEKVPVTMEEPPPIKAVRAAPGMSATSGPLEDFPEGGDMRFD